MKRRAIGALLALACAACNASFPEPRFERSGNTDRATPLGPGYVLMPIGTDDDALLGRALSKAPEPGRALEEVAGPNPCVDMLGATTTVGMVSTLEDAEQLSASAKGRAALGVYGFSAQASHATHFVYRLVTEKKTVRDASADYLACCKQKACGYGVVTELVYGDGEYSAAEETSGAASVEVVNIASARGTASLKLLRKRKVHGWIAAKILIHPGKDPAEVTPQKDLGPMGAADVRLDVDSASAQSKEIYAREKISLCPVDADWAFCDGQDKVSEYAFAVRYRELLGTDELVDMETRRNKGVFFGGLGLAAAGFLGGTGAGIGIVSTKDGASPVPYYLLLIPSAAALIGGVIMFTATGASPGGSYTDHKVTRADAERLAERYNRALLRKITSDVEQSRWDTKPSAATPIRVTPYVVLGGVGIIGTF